MHVSGSAPSYLDLLGIPFERGARGPDSYDCYGLVREMSHRAGVDLPDFETPGTVQEMADVVGSTAEKWTRVPYGTIGSIVTLRVQGLGAHVGYVVERDRYIHAIEPIGVTTERLTNGSIKPIGFYVYG